MSENRVLTMLDILGIQDFVFRSNRLRDAIYASQLIETLFAELSTLAPKGKILLQGGGNAVLEHPSMKEAKVAAAAISRGIYNKAPELKAIFVHHEIGPDTSTGFARELISLLDKTDQVKNNRALNAPLLGLSVTAACQLTGLPAAARSKSAMFNQDDLVISRGLRSAQALSSEANNAWNALLGDVLKEHSVNDHLEAINLDASSLAFTSENDKLGRSRGDTSLLAIVHVDINGLGKRMRAWLETEPAGANRTFDELTAELDKWSREIHDVARNIYKTILTRSLRGLNWKAEDEGVLYQRGKFDHIDFALCRDGNKYCLPIRPLVLGGDDVTFACDARIALDLAKTALHTVENSTVSHLLLPGEKLTACAGIAIVQAHAPVWRACSLAHELCANAKRWRLQNTDKDVSVLDWQLCYGAPAANLGEARSGLHQSGQANTIELSMRPYPLNWSSPSRPDWNWFTDKLLGKKNDGLRGERWLESRNKLKELPDLCRESTESLGSALSRWNAGRPKDNPLILPPEIKTPPGFWGTATPLCDAIELLYLHQVLDIGAP